MAQLGNLIVTGSSRFLNNIQCQGVIIPFTNGGFLLSDNPSSPTTNYTLISQGNISTSVNNNTIAITPSSQDIVNSGTWDGTNSSLKTALSGKLSTSTNYAGSSSVGGAATSAAKLTNTSKIGDTNKPVYFTANGVPAAISYTIDKSVPSTAVFTDDKVAQTYLSSSSVTKERPYSLLIAGTNAWDTTATKTEGVFKCDNLYYQPNYSMLTLQNTANNYAEFKVVGSNSTNYVSIKYNDITNNTQKWDGSTSYSLVDTLTDHKSRLSSRNVKKNIEHVDKSEVDSFLQLNAVKFDYKTSETDNQAERGFIAEDVLNVLPIIVMPKQYDEAGNVKRDLSLKYMDLVPLLVELCKQQQEEINELKQQINTIKERMLKL